MTRIASRGAGADAALTNEEIHTTVLALARSIGHEVSGLRKHSHPSQGIYSRLREEAESLFCLVDWVHNAGLFTAEEDAPPAPTAGPEEPPA